MVPSSGLGSTFRPGQMDPTGRSLYRSTPSGGGFFGQSTDSPGAFYSNDQIPMGGGRTFSANLAYTLTRQRRTADTPADAKTSQQNLNFGAMFSPTPLWSVSWQAQYNVTEKRFESHVVRLERDLHDWRAAFNFVRNANGNVAVYFSIYLINLPELKLDFDQSTLGD